MARARTSLTTSIHDVRTLVLSYHSLLVMQTSEEQRARSLLVAAAEELRLPLFEWSATSGLEGGTLGGARLGHTREPQAMLAHIKGLKIEAIYLIKDFGSFLNEAATLRLLREICQKFSHTRSLVALTGPTVELPADLEHFATYYDLKLPGPEELEEVVRTVLDSLQARQNLAIDLDVEGKGELVRALHGLTLNQARQAVAQAVIRDEGLSCGAVEAIHARKAELLKGESLLEYFPMEDNIAELAGCTRLKDWLERARVGFSSEAAALNLSPPRGMMLVGIQGCGKSLAAKVVARRWKLPLLKLDVGRLFDKYIGESERNFRKAIAQAEAMSPAVLWLDEIEKAFASSGGGDADGGLGRRLFGFFLTWLQEKRSDVFVVATANDLTSLPPELLRKGRFDEIFFVDLPDAGSRRAIFEIHLKLRKQDPAQVDVDALVLASEGFSGAEIEQAVISGLYRALHAKEQLSTELLLKELGETVPLFVSRREDVERLREMARGRFVPVD